MRKEKKALGDIQMLYRKKIEVVRLIGLEPTRPKSPDPKRHGLARPNDKGFAQKEKSTSMGRGANSCSI